jgi:PAS domain-containing protein
MIDATLLAAILDSLKDPILFADTKHVTLYMNRAAITHYEQGESLIGRSLLECHNERSRLMMVEILAAMQNEGLEERLITDNEKGRIFMRAVRDADGRVLGYYEHYEFGLVRSGNRCYIESAVKVDE